MNKKLILSNLSDDLITSLEASDPRLIKFIQNWFIEYPDRNTPYVFSTPDPPLEGL